MAKFGYKMEEPEEKTLPTPQTNAGKVKRYTSKLGEILHDLEKDTIFFKDYNLEIEANELKTNKDFFKGGKPSMEIRTTLGLFGKFEVSDEWEDPIPHLNFRDRFIRKTKDGLYYS